MQIGMMEHTTLEDLAAIGLKRVEARGGEILVPSSVNLAKCHYKGVHPDQFLVTRVDTEVVITDCGEEHLAHPTAEDNDCDVDWSSGVLLMKRGVDAPVSQASPGLLESPAMFHREVVEYILGDNGLRMMEGAMQGLVDEKVASTSVVDGNLCFQALQYQSQQVQAALG